MFYPGCKCFVSCKRACLQAVKNNHLHCLIYAPENGFRLNEKVFEMAAEKNRLEMMKFLLNNGCPFNDKTARAAAKHGNYECLEWTILNGFPIDTKSTYAAASNGHVECLELLHKNGCKIAKAALNAAAKGGHVECVKFIINNQLYSLDVAVFVAASKSNNLFLLQYLKEKNCPWNASVCAGSIYNTTTLVYLRESGCPWDEKTLEFAAMAGQFYSLKYAHENGCPGWNYNRLRSTIQNGRDVKCPQYIESHRNCTDVCNQKTLVSDKIYSSDDGMCIICTEKKIEITYNPCNHKICCISCNKILMEQNPQCPMCRSKIYNFFMY